MSLNIAVICCGRIAGIHDGKQSIAKRTFCTFCITNFNVIYDIWDYSTNFMENIIDFRVLIFPFIIPLLEITSNVFYF